MVIGAAQATEDTLTQCVASIYEAALAPDRWMAALTRLRNMFGLSFAASVVRSSDLATVEGIAAGVDHDDYQAFLCKYYRGSIFITSTEWYVGQIVRTTQLVPAAEFHRTEMFQEYWRPRDLFAGLRLAISADDGGPRHSVNLIRPPSNPTFEDSDIALARVLMPHMQRADELARRLRHSDMLASAAFAVLDSLRHAILLIDQNGRLMHTNAAADTLLGLADGLSATRGILQAATPVWTSRLHALLARAAGAGGAAVQAGALRLPRVSGARALAVLVMPFRAEAHWSLARRPMILVCVTDLETVSVHSGRQLAELFGLTDAEAALAADLLAGLDLREIAKRTGRGITTVRSHLAKLMAKTDVNRQSELLRVLGALPRLRDPN